MEFIINECESGEFEFKKYLFFNSTSEYIKENLDIQILGEGLNLSIIEHQKKNIKYYFKYLLFKLLTVIFIPVIAKY